MARKRWQTPVFQGKGKPMPGGGTLHEGYDPRSGKSIRVSIPPRDDPEERDPGDPWQRHYEKAQAEGHEKLSAAELHGAALHAERIGDKAGVKKFAAARDKKQSRQDAAQTGKRGGRFYLTASGTKVYLKG